jgi:hypothetical protein
MITRLVGDIYQEPLKAEAKFLKDMPGFTWAGSKADMGNTSQDKRRVNLYGFAIGLEKYKQTFNISPNYNCAVGWKAVSRNRQRTQ